MLSTTGRAAVRRVAAGGSQSFSQWSSKLRRVHSLRVNLQPHAISSLRRSYVTTTTAATKPRTGTSEPAEKQPKNPKAAKPKSAKPKAKGAAKPKENTAPKKKSRKPTEKQKEKLGAQKDKLEIKELKATALLSPPKQLPASGWLVLASSVLTKGVEQGSSIDSIRSRLKELSTKYRSMDASERENYDDVASQNKAANEAAFKKWVESYTPEQIKAANKARLTLKRKIGKKGTSKYSPIPDPRLPKKTVDARALYVKERWKSGDMKGMPFAETSKVIQKEWSELSAAEKKPFEDAANADRGRYEQEYKTAFHRDVPARKVAASATI